MTNENLELVKALISVSKPACILAGVYAAYSMLTSGLFAKDMHISQERVTHDPFKVHRNPFYTGMEIAMGGLLAMHFYQLCSAKSLHAAWWQFQHSVWV